VYGGLTADHIKAGTISYDRLNVAYAQVSGASLAGDFGSATASVIQVANDAHTPNVIQISGLSSVGSGKRFSLTLSHQTLSMLGGVPMLNIDSSLSSVDNLGGEHLLSWAALISPSTYSMLGGQFECGLVDISRGNTTIYIKILSSITSSSPLYIGFARHSIE